MSRPALSHPPHLASPPCRSRASQVCIPITGLVTLRFPYRYMYPAGQAIPPQRGPALVIRGAKVSPYLDDGIAGSCSHIGI